jgi:LysM repeat protein
VSSSDNFSSNESSSSPLQRIAIGIGTLVVISLIVFAAIFLAMEDLPDEQAGGEIAAGTPTVIVATSTPVQRAATATPIPPTNTQTATSIPSDTPIPTLTLTPTSESAAPTDTPVPAPTATDTPIPEAPATPTQAPPPPTQPPGVGVCNPPPDWVQYEVQKGDTLKSLAERTGTTQYDLYEINCLESYTIVPGQLIYLPFIPPTPTATNTPTPVTPSPTATRTGTPSPTPYPPEIFSNEPDTAKVSADIIMAVQGRYFLPDQDGFRVELRTGSVRYNLQLGELKTSTSFETFIPADTVEPGIYDLWVINPDNQFDVQRSAYTAEAE